MGGWSNACQPYIESATALSDNIYVQKMCVTFLRASLTYCVGISDRSGTAKKISNSKTKWTEREERNNFSNRNVAGL